MQAWNDFCLPIGLDHHSVRCKVKCNSNCSPQKRVRATSKGWKPHLNHLPATKSISCRYRTRKPSITIDNLESALLHADLRGELISAYLLLVGIFCNFGLPQSCNHSGEHAGSREAEGLQIRKLQKRETKSWKSE